jgi:UDP-N-acetylmuramoyl-L-alanyl-D-glutamate--2,6-diaminopimelate ligase
VKLTQLLHYLNIDNILNIQQQEIIIQSLQVDSRKVNRGDLFIAVPGSTSDGRQYISQAIDNGAMAVFAEIPYSNKSNIDSDVPIVCIEELTKKIGIIAKYFYNNIGLNIIGVTGTNGKSTVCYYIAEILKGLSCSCATIGTLGIGINNKYIATEHTTPDPIELQKNLSYIRDKKTCNIAMEVSSHALIQHRASGVDFKTAVFTNLTQDHLDYHKNISSYWQAKLKLFLEYSVDNVIINLDDPYGRQLVELLPTHINVIGYSLEKYRKFTDNIIRAYDFKYDLQGTSVTIKSKYGEMELTIPVFGDFNLSNILAAFAAVLTFGYSFEEILSVLPEVSAVPGRMQYIRNDLKPLVVVDYAHTPDAIDRTLATLKKYCKGKLWCVFGCGGDRDKDKRPAMLERAICYSDYIILTQDNPRTEDPNKITEDILKNNSNFNNIIVELDRFTAIKIAIDKAKEKDIILVAGRGHEEHQIIGKEKIPFSDVKVVEELLEL